MEIDKKRVAHNISNLNKTYQLSALVNVDSFFYALFEHETLLFAQELSLNAGELTLFDGQNIALNEVLVGVYNDRFTLIPADEYSEFNRKNLLEHSLGVPSYIHVHADYNPEADVYICYDIPPEWQRRITKLAKSHSTCHIVSVLLSNILKDSLGTVIHWCKIGGQTLMICVIEGALKLVSNFGSSSSMHVLYYTNLVREQFELNEGQVRIELSGDFYQPDGTTSLLRKYFRNVSYKEASFIFNERSMKSSIFYPLKSISECA